MFVKNPPILDLLLVHLKRLFRPHVDQLWFVRFADFTRLSHRPTCLPTSQLQPFDSSDHSSGEVTTSSLVFPEEMIIKMKGSRSSVARYDGSWSSERYLRLWIHEPIASRTEDMSTRSPRVVLRAVVAIVAQTDRQDLLSFRPQIRACRILRLIRFLSCFTDGR